MQFSFIRSQHAHTHTQQDTDFLESLFKELTEESTTAERYRELAELLREVNNFALVAKLPKNKLYTWSGFMKAIEGMLVSYCAAWLCSLLFFHIVGNS